MTNTSKTLPLAILAALVATASLADDYPSFDTVIAGGALICDEPQSVINMFNNVPAPDCGVLRAQSGMAVTVTIIGLHEGTDRTYPLAMFEFHEPTPWGVDTQYGWWGGDIPSTEPAGLDL